MGRRIDSILVAMKAVRVSLDTVLDHHVKTSPLPVACQKGCTDCCRIFVGATGLEAAVIAYYWLQFPDWKAIGRDLKKVAAKMSAKGVTQRSYAKSRIACPFLNSKDGRCKIYHVRPCACRCHFSVDLPERCKADSSKGMKLLDTRHFDDAHRAAEAFITADPRDRQLGPMPLLVLWAGLRVTDKKDRIKEIRRFCHGLPQPVEWMQRALEDGGLVAETSVEEGSIPINKDTKFTPKECPKCGDRFLAYGDEEFCIDCGGLPEEADAPQTLLVSNKEVE